jgi:diamine N-acetyltransferase
MSEAAPAPVYLSSKRLELSPPEPADAEVLAAWLNDPDVWVPYGMDAPTSIEAERRWISDQALKSDEINLIIRSADQHFPLGLVGLRNIDGINGSARLGVLIGSGKNRGQGLGSEATRLLLEHGFSFLNLRRINLCVLASNQAAIKMYTRMGFVQEGRERQAQLRAGNYVDRLHFGLLRPDYLQEDK